jgi:hypothetical protein
MVEACEHTLVVWRIDTAGTIGQSPTMPCDYGARRVLPRVCVLAAT